MVKPVSLHRQATVALRHSGCFVQSEKVVSCPIPCSPSLMFVAPPANKGEKKCGIEGFFVRPRLSLKCFYYLNRKSKPQTQGNTEVLIQVANNPAPHVNPCISAVVIPTYFSGHTIPPLCHDHRGLKWDSRPKFRSLRRTRVTPNSSTPRSPTHNDPHT